MNKKRLILLISTVCILVLIIVYYFYTKSAREIKILEPEYTVFKDKPKDPGGIDIPNSDSMVYEQLKARSSRTMLNEINVLPDPEQPIEINFKNSTEEKIVNSIDQILEKLDLFSDEGTESSSPSKDKSPAPVEVIINDDGLDKLSAELEQNVQSKDENISLKSDNEMQTQQHEEVQLIQNENLSDNNEIDTATSLRISKSSTDFHKFSDANFDANNQNGYKIQLAMARTESEAKKIWQNIKKKHSKTLENTNLILKKVDSKNEKIFYLVMAGVFPSPYKAKLVCSNLKAHNQNCLVTK